MLDRVCCNRRAKLGLDCSTHIGRPRTDGTKLHHLPTSLAGAMVDTPRHGLQVRKRTFDEWEQLSLQLGRYIDLRPCLLALFLSLPTLTPPSP
jgi:hypothetical protein